LLTIDRTLCAGCGTCVDVCPTGAITLGEDDGISTIDLALCDECLACLDVCPNDAILRVESLGLVPGIEGEVVEGEVTGSEVVPVSEPWRPITIRQPSQLVALAGTALTFVGSWLVPRAADALLDAMERRLRQAGDSPVTATRRPRRPASMRQMGSGGRGGRFRQRRRRWRGR
jgi:NAD-dependent dihydropyrimidine dehydrogenase PreA subunit